MHEDQTHNGQKIDVPPDQPTLISEADMLELEQASENAVEEILLEIQQWMRLEITRWHVQPTAYSEQRIDDLRSKIAAKLVAYILPWSRS